MDILLGVGVACLYIGAVIHSFIGKFGEDTP